jgi:hypothetical protein
MSFSRPLPLILEMEKPFFLDECTTKMLILLWKNYLKIPIRNWIRGEWIFSHLKAFCLL